MHRYCMNHVRSDLVSSEYTDGKQLSTTFVLYKLKKDDANKNKAVLTTIY